MLRYSEAQRAEVLDYIYYTFGAIEEIYVINGFDEIELEVAVIKPTEDKDFFTLVTVGLGAYYMNVPEDIEGREMLSRCELVTAVPSDWKVGEVSREYYWPIGYMQDIVRMLINEKSWIGPMHTVDFGEEIPDSNMQFTGGLIIPPELLHSQIKLEHGLINNELGEINMYYVYPLYREELDLKVRLGGFPLYERIMKLIDEPIPIDRNRLSVGKRYKKSHFKKSEEITGINYSGPNGCIVTDRIMVNGNKVKYCYREEPDEQDFWDSGWRFVSGKETKEELCNKNKTNICSLNEVVAIDEEVRILLDSPYGSIYRRDEKGMFQLLEKRDEDYDLGSDEVYRGQYEIIEDGMIHMDTILCKELAVSELNGLNHMAAFMTWAMKNNLLSEEFMDENSQILDEIRKKGTKAPLREYLYNKFDAQLRNVFFTEKGNKFIAYYYNTNEFTCAYTKTIDEYAKKIFGDERYKSKEFKNEAYVFLDYDEKYCKDIEELIDETYTSWEEKVYTRSLQPVIRDKELEIINEYIDDNSAYFGKIILYLEDLRTELIEMGVFTYEEICMDLEYSLWVMFALINFGDYTDIRWAKNSILMSEKNAKGSGKWYYRYAILLTRVGELEEAFEYAKKGVKEEPDFPWGWLHLAKLQAHFGEKEKALESVAKGKNITAFDEAYEFRVLEKEILNEAPLEDMMFHLIDEESDREINAIKDSGDYDDNEEILEKLEEIKYMTLDETGMQERKYIFNTNNFGENDLFVYIGKEVPKYQRECYLYIRNVNNEYFSKMDKEVLQVFANMMEADIWLHRTLSDGHEYYLEAILSNNKYDTHAVYRRDDGMEVLIDIAQTRDSFDKAFDMDEIDLRLIMKAKENAESQDEIQQ